MHLRSTARLGFYACLWSSACALPGCIKPNGDYDEHRPSDTGTEKLHPEPVGEDPTKSPEVGPDPTDSHTDEHLAPTSSDTQESSPTEAASTTQQSTTTSTSSSDSDPSSASSTSSTSSLPPTNSPGLPPEEPESCQLYQCVAFNEHAAVHPGHRWLNATSALLLSATSQDRRVARIEIVTGLGVGLNSLGLRKHEGGRPGQSLGKASWNMSYQVGWQGADLSPPVKIPAGENVWVEIDPVANTQASIRYQGTLLPLWYSADGANNWQLQYRGVMLKVFCCRP